MRGFSHLPFKFFNYRLSRAGLLSPSLPINLTFSVTNMCQSRCRTCNIWKISNKRKSYDNGELELSEIEKIFRSMGRIFFFNISGGCPFLRKDLPEIISLAINFLKPSIIHIPTNAIEPDLVENGVLKILKVLGDSGRKTELSLKLSLDGVGIDHDDIRGVNGNFEKLRTLMARLFKLKKEYSNLNLGFNTIVSKINVKKLAGITDFVNSFPVDSYVIEIAETRAEMDNEDDDITPEVSDYRNAVNLFIDKSLLRLPHLPFLGKATESLRIVYYRNSVEILERKKQIPKCYGGISNAHISSTGEVWPCAVLGDKMSLGNLRNVDYDFRKIWSSAKAREVRNFIKSDGCFCPLANQAYSNILMSPVQFLKALKYFLAQS